MRIALVVLLAVLPLCGQVKFTEAPGQIEVEIAGRPFTTFYAGGSAPKPFLAPLRSASGKVITRRFPMEQLEGESRDHPHHRGLWITHGDVNGVDFWINEAGTQGGRHGVIELLGKPQTKGGADEGSIRASFVWRTPEGQALLQEDRLMVFRGGPDLRVIDFDVTFTAMEKLDFADTKEGFFAIRLRDELTEQKGSGKMTSSTGASGMPKVWGSRAPWVDYSGQLDGEAIGVAIFDRPGNYNYPTYWHARDYGLFAANPFGAHDFLNDKSADAGLKVEKGGKVRFRYRVVIHPGDAAKANVPAMFEEWLKSAS
jgi:hypothetical protein